MSLLIAVLLALPAVVSAEATPQEVGVLETSMGKMVFRFLEDEAPRTTANFNKLVREGSDGDPFGPVSIACKLSRDPISGDRLAQP